jgi:DNA-binding winged helix-turn-helix (wHTH) protein/tetratricopeptide (TPR) repeat protein
LGAETQSIKLAQEPPFRLDDLLVDPARRRLSRGDREAILEPRVMQVLVLLAQAQGAVVSRDELIERCWGGRIVVENAINRAISRIRQVVAELGLEGFEIETITKVGYRLAVPPGLGPRHDPPLPWPTVEREPAAVAGPSSPMRRRLIVGGAAAVVAAGAGAWLWTRRAGHVPVPEAVELHRRGQLAQRQAVPEQVRQAIAFFRQATEIDPLYAEAWGGLALAYRHVLEGFTDSEFGHLPSLIESAARRALALDPDNADAQVALALVLPYFRNWQTIERDLLRIEQRHADHWFVQAQLGLVRYEVGRWRDGLPHTERQLRIEPFILIPRISQARALWSLGRLHEAEVVIDNALARWNGHFLPWGLKYAFLLCTGRPAAAAAFATQPELRPERLRPNGVEARVTLARAVERRDPADVAASLADLRQQTAAIDSVVTTAPIFVLLGRHDLALAALERYFFGAPAGEVGPAVAPPGRYDRRYSAFLFMPPMAPLWRDPRFAAMLERIGLERYWRETGTRPDFRAAG